MLKSIIKNVKIKGISVVVPSKELCLTDDKSLYGGDEKQLKRVMRSSGFNKRRVADENVTASDLCVKAAENMFADMNFDRKAIDAVVFVTQTPDYHMPATACVIQHRLGLKESTAAFDVNQGCAGYAYGVWIASMLANSGCRYVLLLVGDTSSKYTDMFREHQSAPIFGDAGSATLFEFDEKAAPMYFDIGTDGSNYEVIMARNGGFRNPPKKDMFYEDGTFKYEARMDGLKVMEFTLSKVPGSIKDVLERAGITKDDIDFFVMHQANKFILENIALEADIPLDKMPMETISKYGNQSCTSIPGAICDALEEEVQKRPLKLCISGFGIGLSWVSAVLDIDRIYCSGIRNFD